MSCETRPAMLLSKLVQTRSIELVLAPIASQVTAAHCSSVCVQLTRIVLPVAV